MSNDLDELARRYLDLWQDHLSDLADDGEVAQAIAKSVELMNGSAAAFAKMAENSTNASREQTNDQGRPGDITTPTGAPPPGPASGDSDTVLDQLARRIGELEQRINELESAPGSAGKGSKQ